MSSHASLMNKLKNIEKEGVKSEKGNSLQKETPRRAEGFAAYDADGTYRRGVLSFLGVS